MTSSISAAIKREHLDEKLKDVVAHQTELPQHEISSALKGIPHNPNRGRHVRRVDDDFQKYTFFIFNDGNPWNQKKHEFVAKFRKHSHFDHNHNYDLHLEKWLIDENDKPMGHAEFVAELHYEHDQPLRMAYKNGGPAPKVITEPRNIYHMLSKHGLTESTILGVISNFETEDHKISKIIHERDLLRENLIVVQNNP